MAGFLTNLGLAAGRSILYGQEFQERQAELDLRKQQVEMGKLALGNAQRQQQTQAEVGSFLQSEMQKDAANFTDPALAAGEYQKAAGIALSNGDFVSANTMTELAKGKAVEARDEAVAQQKQLQLKKEDLSNTAADYQSNPTAEGGQDLVRKAIAAGLNPATIPPNLQSPAGRKWVNDQQMASMSGKERMNFLEKVSKDQEDRAEKRREFNIRQQDLQENRRINAQLREAMIADRREARASRADRAPVTKEISGSTYQYDPSQTIKGDRDTPDPAWVKLGEKVSAQQRNITTSLAGSAAEAARNIRQITKFPLGTTTGPFANLSDHRALDAVAKAGTNAFTPETTQMFQTAGAGLALQVGRVETLGGGRGVNETQVKQLERQLTPAAGDQPLEQLYKVATGAELLSTRMRNQPPPSNPTLRAEWDKTLAELDAYPKTDAILAAAQNPTQRNKLLSMDKSYAGLLQDIHKNSEKAPAAAPPLPAGGGLPSGWSVQEH